ncbi:four and a half LIM domains protein 2-like [Convolutriloba macropyga]|uniref:four and a half LIM domains protein 2-like n=1 Tax=Convolutriloba macropyga TaxID=536237 RepID=UPI003F522141
MSTRAERRAARAQIAETPTSETVTDISEPNSSVSSRRSRRNRIDTSDDTPGTPQEELTNKAVNLEQEASRADIAATFGKLGQKFQRNRRSRKTSGETEDEIVIIGDDSAQKLESGAPENPFDQLDSKKEMKKGGSGHDFTCHNCERSLLGYRFVNKDANAYCVNCYHKLFANKCQLCNDIITVDDQDLTFKGKHWHARCFKCTDCSKSLVGENFGVGTDKESLFCTECYEKDFAPKCVVCNEPFKGGTMKLTWNGGSYHSECFKCFNCNDVIGKDSFHPHDNKAYCDRCWDELYSVKCTKCKGPIKSNGVTYRMEPYHRECFTCSECDDILAGQRFTLQNDEPICSECFGKKYAHKCYECSLPIKGDSGNRYLMFEDFYWHCECFYCKQCNMSLLGTNFIADQPTPGAEINVYCQPCGFAVKGYTQDNKSLINVGNNKENVDVVKRQNKTVDDDDDEREIISTRRSRQRKV